MLTFRWNRADNSITCDGASSPIATGQVTIAAALYESPLFRVAFVDSDPAAGDLGQNFGSDPGLQLIVKRQTGSQRFDEAALLPSPIFTRQAADALGNYYYDGALSLAEPILEKMLGADPAPPRREVFTLTISGGLANREGVYFTIRKPGATAYYRPWLKVSSVGDTPAADVNATDIEIAVDGGDDGDDTVAAAIATQLAAFSGFSDDWDVVVAGATITFTAAETVTYGSATATHSAGNTGYTLTLTQCGSTGLGESDVDSVTLSAWLVHSYTGDVQVSPEFYIEVKNAGYRGAAVPTLGVTSRTRVGTVAIGNGDSSVTTLFADSSTEAAAFPSASWRFRDVRVVNTTDGSPATLNPATLTARSATGFTILLTGPTDSANYTLEYTADLTL